MSYLPDTEWTLRWTRSLKWDSHQKMTKLFTTKTYQFQSTWKKTNLLTSSSCKNIGSSQSYFSQSTQVPILHKLNPTENYVSLWISGISTPWFQMTKLTLNNQLARRQMQQNTWKGNLYSASLFSLRLSAVCRWRTNGQWKWLHSILPAEFLPQETCTRS